MPEPGDMKERQLGSDLKLAGDSAWVKGEAKAHGGEPSTEGWELVKARLEKAGVQTYQELNEDLDKAIHGNLKDMSAQEWRELDQRLRSHGVDIDETKELRRNYFEGKKASEEEIKAGETGKEFPGKRALDRILSSTDEAFKKRALEEWRIKFADTATPEDWKRATDAVGARAKAEAVTRVEIPKTEREYRLFIRREAIKVLDLLKTDTVTSGEVLDKIRLNLPGYSETERKAIAMFPPEIPNIEKIRKEIIDELNARCNLHNAYIKEETYQEMKIAVASEQYVKDFDAGSFREITNETFDWLSNLVDRGDSLSAKRIDTAFSILVWAGEGRAPAGYENIFSQFTEFIGKPNVEGKVLNIYDDNYPSEEMDGFLDKLSEAFGDDASELAWQMFQGLRLEGEYRPQHYLYGLTHSGKNRKFLAEVLEVVVGSARILRDDEADHHSFEDEIGRLANLCLGAKMKDESQGGVKVQGLFMGRVNETGFLRGTRWMKRGKLALERGSLTAIKKANSVVAAWVEIGKLGDKTSEKSTKIDGAVAQVVTIASSLNELVDQGVVAIDDCRRQILIESQNVLWELSTRNEINMVPGQRKESVRFLLPSGFNKLINLISMATLEGISAWPDGTRYVVLTDGDMSNISGYAKGLREQAVKVFENLPTDDLEKIRYLVSDEKKAAKFVLPTVRGQQALPPEGAFVARYEQRMQTLADKISLLLRGSAIKR